MSLSSVKAWLFDLDNTLYPAHSAIFPQIHERMSLFIVQRLGHTKEQAEKLRADYFHHYGTTMRGLMVEHKIAPQDFMDFVHDVPLADIAPCERQARVIASLPGRKIIFTNADRKHAKRILSHLNLADHFPDIFDIQDGDYVCKPHEGPYKALLKQYGLRAEDCCMVDDMEANLQVPNTLGMKTLWLRHEAEWLRRKPNEPAAYPHCHYVTDDLIPFLEQTT